MSLDENTKAELKELITDFYVKVVSFPTIDHPYKKDEKGRSTICTTQMMENYIFLKEEISNLELGMLKVIHQTLEEKLHHSHKDDELP